MFIRDSSGVVHGFGGDFGCHFWRKRMRETIYEWMKNLAVLDLFFTAVMNFLPDGKYNKYIRHFLGLLLILLLITPILQMCIRDRYRGYKEKNCRFEDVITVL